MLVTVTLNVAVDKSYWVGELKPGEVMRVRECSITAGGKGLNVSKVAKIAGAEVVATGFTGGHSGALVEEQLDAMQLRHDFIHVKGETRTCINIIDEKTGRQTEFLEPGFTVCAEEVDRFKAKFDLLSDRADIVTISGSAPRGCDASIYSELIRTVRSKGKKIILDSSGEYLKLGITALPTLIKPNRDEIVALTGREITDRASLIESAAQLHRDGIEYVAVSLGKDGALLVCGEGVFQGVTPDIPVVNTVGCGDAMVAAFAVGFERGYEAQELLRFAVAVSTANALNRETGFYRPEQLAAILEQCKAVRIA